MFIKRKKEKANAKKVSTTTKTTTTTMVCPFCLKARPTMFLAYAFGLLFCRFVSFVSLGFLSISFFQQ